MTSHFDDGTPLDRSRRKDTDGDGRRRGKGSRFSQRDAAVARQAQRVLMTELMDLPGVWVREVRPAPDATRLVVLISSPPAELIEVQQQVLARAVSLRQAVARGLTRKKAPQLSFVFVPGEVER